MESLISKAMHCKMCKKLNGTKERENNCHAENTLVSAIVRLFYVRPSCCVEVTRHEVGTEAVTSQAVP